MVFDGSVACYCNLSFGEGLKTGVGFVTSYPDMKVPVALVSGVCPSFCVRQLIPVKLLWIGSERNIPVLLTLVRQYPDVSS